MITKTCALCGQTYFVAVNDNTPLCHTCYCELFNNDKSLDDKIEYLKKLKEVRKIKENSLIKQ